LAAQTAETVFFLLRPLASAIDSSPATLRLAVRPAENGVSAEIVKRKGPAAAGPIVNPMPELLGPRQRAGRAQPWQVFNGANSAPEANIISR
jgi:cell division inhibitor SulA/protein ImuA